MNKQADAALLERLKLRQEWLASFGQAGRQLWLEDADLTGLDLSDRDLSQAHLAGARLDSVCLCQANLYSANLASASLCGVNLTRGI